MKSLIAAASTLAVLSTVPALAHAQGLGPTSIYGTLGYSQGRNEGVDLGAVQGRLGARFGQYVGAETELAAGVDDDKTYVAGAPVNVELEHQAAIYGVGFLPVTPKADLYARVGYGETKVKASVPGASATDRGESWNYGVGGQYFLDDANGVRADYTRHDFKKDAGEADVWSVGYVRKF
jgi:outer membrane immunogenic protein